MDLSVFNFPAILVAALAAFFVGFMWHGPVFGKVWMKLMKISAADMKKGQKEMGKKMPLYMAIAYLQQLVTSFLMALFSLMLGASDTFSSVLLAFLIWIGFIATTLLNGVLWEKRTVPLYLFNIAYQFVNLVVIALIVGLWR